MQKQNYAIIISAIVIATVLLNVDLTIKPAYAITLTSAEPDGSMGTPSFYEYNSAHDYLLTSELEGGVIHVHIVNGETLALVADVVTTLTTGGEIDCSASSCFVVGAITNVPTIIRIALSTQTIVATYTESEYGICGSPSGVEVYGTSVFVLMGGGSCPYSGIYNIPVSFTADVGGSNIQWNEYDSTTSFGNIVGESCLVNGNYYHFDVNNQRVRKYALGSHTLTSSNALGALITHGACDTDFSTGYAYATSINGDWVKRIALDDLTVDGTSFSITNPQYVMGRGDSVYVSRDDATTVTAISKAGWASGFVLFSSLAHNDVAFFVGNSSRMNMVAPTTNDNIYYVVTGLFDSENTEDIPEAEVCIDTNLDGDSDVCFQDENGDGLADSTPIGIVTSTEGPVSGTGKFLCQFQVITECTNGQPDNDDPTTNGIGYILYFVLLFGMLAVLGSILKGNIVGNYGLMFSVAIVVGSAGMVAAFGWLDSTLFYTSIFIVVAIAGTKITSMFLQNRQGGE